MLRFTRVVPIWYVILVLVLAGCPVAPSLILPLIPSSPSPAPAGPAPAPLTRRPCPEPNGAPADLLANPRYLEFEAVDLDTSGAPATGLTQSEFIVKDGSLIYPIAYFHENTSGTPASIVIVLDAAETMVTKLGAGRGDTAFKVHAAFAKSLANFGHCDEIGLVVTGGKYAPGFHPTDSGLPASLSDVTTVSVLTTDRSVALTALENIVPAGPENLSEAIHLGVRLFVGAYYPARELVIVTDGLDSRALSAGERFFQTAKLYGITTEIIGIGREETSASSFPSSLQRSEALDLNAVRDFAATVHASVLLAKPVSDDDGASLAQSLSAARAQISDSYSIGVVAPDADAHPTLSRTNSSGDVLTANLVTSASAGKEASSPGANFTVRCAPRAPTPPSITSQSGYTQVRVSVADSRGHPVHGLKPPDFVIKSHLNPLSVVYSHEDRDGIPTSVMMAVDVSGSMTKKLENAYPTIANIILGLNSCDDVGLMVFSDEPLLVEPLTTDHRFVAQRVASLKAYGATGLYDAIDTSAQWLAKGRYPNRALILVTDGIDNTSRASMSDVLTTLNHDNVQVDVIGLGRASSSLQLSLLSFGFASPSGANQSVINHLAARTGGVDYLVSNGADNQKQLALAASRVEAALGPGYDVGFTAPPGELEEPKISIARHPDYSVEIISVPIASSLIHHRSQGAKP